jgi:hypothetical protein
MKHSSTRELFGYWNARRGSRVAPDRADIEPSAIRRSLADTFVLARHRPAEYRFRIAGTRVCAALGRELKGDDFVPLWSAASREPLRELLAIAGHETVGIAAGARAETSDGAVLDFELLVLPLHHRGRSDTWVLGALASIETPYWFGISVLGPFALGSIRYLHPSTAGLPSHRALAAPAPSGRMRHGFVVYDGGQP